MGQAPLIEDPVWIDNDGNGSPEKDERVGYVSGSNIKVKATFKVETSSSGEPIENVTIQVTNAQLGLQGDYDVGSVSGDFSTLPFEIGSFESGSTQYFSPDEPLVVEWSYSYDGRAYEKFGVSKHTVYVTLQEKSPELDKVYLTLLHLATSNPGSENQAEAVWNTWQLFAKVKNPQLLGSESLAPQGVKTWYGKPIFYYPEGIGLGECPTSFEDFLTAKKDPWGDIEEDKKDVIAGNCGLLAALFRKTLQINQIDSQLIDAAPIAEYDPIQPGLMLIKHWDFPDIPELQSYPNEKEYKWHLYLYYNSMVMAIKEEEVQDSVIYGDIKNILEGIPGQNVETPSEKAFINHALVKIGLDEFQDRPYFDPAYGRTYIDERDFEKQAVDGYAKSTYQSDDQTPDYYNYQVRHSEGLNNIKFEVK